VRTRKTSQDQLLFVPEAAEAFKLATANMLTVCNKEELCQLVSIAQEALRVWYGVALHCARCREECKLIPTTRDIP